MYTIKKVNILKIIINVALLRCRPTPARRLPGAHSPLMYFIEQLSRIESLDTGRGLAKLPPYREIYSLIVICPLRGQHLTTVEFDLSGRLKILLGPLRNQILLICVLEGCTPMVVLKSPRETDAFDFLLFSSHSGKLKLIDTQTAVMHFLTYLFFPQGLTLRYVYCRQEGLKMDCA